MVKILGPSGSQVCEPLECPVSTTIGQLKAKVELAGGMKAETLALCQASREDCYLKDGETLVSCGLPEELHALELSKLQTENDALVEMKKKETCRYSCCSPCQCQAAPLHCFELKTLLNSLILRQKSATPPQYFAPTTDWLR